MRFLKGFGDGILNDEAITEMLVFLFFSFEENDSTFTFPVNNSELY